jgi:hypothetical protein
MHLNLQFIMWTVGGAGVSLQQKMNLSNSKQIFRILGKFDE